MREYEIKILDTAKRDIANNHKYISETLENELAGYAHTVDIYREISKLRYAPRAHKIYENVTDLECRITRVRQYLILYSIDDDKAVVYILRVYHSHRNPAGMVDVGEIKKALESKGRGWD